MRVISSSTSFVAGYLLLLLPVQAFINYRHGHSHPLVQLKAATSTTDDVDSRRESQKKQILELLGGSRASQVVVDPILVDPITKEPLSFRTSTASTSTATTFPLLLGRSQQSNSNDLYEVTSPSNTFQGRKGSYLNLLEPVQVKQDDANPKESQQQSLLRAALPFVPPPLRSLVPNSSEEYIPMRDLFTSPAVSFAYERGWRQGFGAAGFPGPDIEAQMALDYLGPAITANRNSSNKVLVDMSLSLIHI